MNQRPPLFSWTICVIQHKRIASPDSANDVYGFYKKRNEIADDFGLSCDDLEESAKNSIQKVVKKVLYINIPTLLTDSDISPATLQSCVDKLDTIIKLLVHMAKVSMRQDFLRGPNDESFIQSYVDISATLKGVMVEFPTTGPSALAWNVRKPKLWYWCRTMLEHTQNPLCYLVKKENTDFATKLVKLHDVNTQLIMEIAFGDDVADNLRDKIVTDAILRIPFASTAQRAEDLNKITNHRQIGGKGPFTEYYKQAVKVWDDALEKLKTIFNLEITSDRLSSAYQLIQGTLVSVPETGLEEILSNPFIEKVYAFELPGQNASAGYTPTEWTPFRIVKFVDPEQFKALGTTTEDRLILNITSHFRRIMKSMAFSLQMNINPHAENLNPEMINQILPYNMMVNWFRFSEETLAIAHIPCDSLPSESDLSTLRHIINQSQLSASLSNSIATLKRELEENDLSNVFFFELNDKLNQSIEVGLESSELSQGGSNSGFENSSDSDESTASSETSESKTSFIRHDFNKFAKTNGYNNHFFSHYSHYEGDSTGYPPDLLELLLVRRYAVNQLYTQLNYIFSEAEPDTGSFSQACQNLGKQNMSFQKLLPGLREQSILAKYETLKLYFSNAERFSTHIDLIDSYTKSALSKTSVIKSGLEKSDSIYHSMVNESEQLSTQELKEATLLYCQHIARDFLFMYLLFKQNSEGEI